MRAIEFCGLIVLETTIQKLALSDPNYY